MAEKKLYASLEDWNEINYEELTSDSTMLVNTTGDDQGLIAAIRAGEFKGDKGDKGDPGNVTLSDGLVISSQGYTFLAQESTQEQREVLNDTDEYQDPNSLFLTKGDIGITSEDVVGGDDRRLVPLGGIIMWAGLVNEIPIGWYLCNGANGTPDLRDRFIVGAGSTYSVGSTGGVNTVTLTSAQSGLPAHDHTIYDPGHSHSGVFGFYISSFASPDSGAWNWWNNHPAKSTDAATTGISIYNNTAQNASTAHENRPPYYALAFIQFKGYE